LPALVLAAAALATLGLGGLAAAQETSAPPGPSVVTSCPTIYTEVEPNNSITVTNFITDIAGAEVRGGITPAGDVDFYSFSANAGDRIWSYINTSNATSSTDSVLTLLNSVSTTLQLDDDNGSQSSLSSAIAGAPITQTGTYALQVRQFGGATIMNPYSLYINRTSGAAVPEAEPNDTLLTANPYAFDSVVTATIPITTDIDYYTFTLAQNDKIVIQVDGDPDRNGTNLSRVNQFNPNLDLLDSTGALITAVDSDSIGGNGGLLSENLVYTNTSAISTTFAVRIKFDPSTPPDDDVGIYNLHIYKVGICVPATGTPTGTATTTAVPTGTATTTAVPTGTATTTTVPTGTATTTQTATSIIPTVTLTVLPPTTTATGTATVTATACPTYNFSDVAPSDYFYTPVQYLACHGVIGGYSDGTFRPYNNTTRGQMSKIVALGFSLPIQTPVSGQTFEDVPPGSTFFGYIETLAARQIASGYACGSTNPQTGTPEPCVTPNNRPYFRPGNNISRGQLVKLVVIAASQQLGWDILNPATPTFSDVPAGSTFYEYIETAVCHGVINGYADTTFRPSNSAFRGQIAKIVYLAVTGSAPNCVNPTATATPTP
jgi:hypothetical protein